MIKAQARKKKTTKASQLSFAKRPYPPVGFCFPGLMCMVVFAVQKDSLCCVLHHVLDDREDRVCLRFNQLLQLVDLLILFVEVLYHCFDVCVRLNGRRIGLVRLEF